MALSPAADLFATSNAKSEHVLVASCLGKVTGGGLVLFDGNSVELVDRMSCTGLTLAQDRLVRLMWCEADFQAPGELLIYDSRGVEKYYRIDSLNDPHDVIWDGKNYVVVSSGENSILWIAPDGSLAQKATMPGEPDSWHLNSLYLDGENLLVTSFGRFSEYREWLKRADEKLGVVFNYQTGTDVLTGLDRPHHPRRMDGNWIICNSGMRELLQIDAQTHKVVRRAQLERWTRGLTFSDKYIFIGESARRNRVDGDKGEELASIAILERASWLLVDRVNLPFEEVYDLALVPVPLAEGIRKGFNTNPQRVLEQNQYSLFTELGIKPDNLWAVGNLLPPEACAVELSADIEASLPPNSLLRSSYRLKNCGPAMLVSAMPHPVLVGYKWIDKESNSQIPGQFFTPLVSVVPPCGKLSGQFRFRTPANEGRFEFRVTLYQHGRGYFDEIDISNAYRFEVLITAAVAPQTNVRANSAVGV